MPSHTTSSNVLSASLRSLSEFFNATSPALYIPIYQRPYSWKPSEIERLFDDVVTGLERAVDDDAALTFVGSVITATAAETDALGSATPPSTLTLIDGQQRLCTFIMAAIVIHNEITYFRNKAGDPDEVDDSELQEGLKWILSQTNSLLSALTHFFRINTEAEFEDMPLLPRLIREGNDRWETSSTTAKYISPMAYLQRSYVEWIQSQSSTNYFVVDVPERDMDETDRAAYELLIRRFKQSVRLSVRKIVDPTKIDWTLPSHSRLRDGDTWAKVLTGTRLPLEVRQAVVRAAEEEPDAARLLNYVLLGRFIVGRVQLAWVNAQNEEYALDMFDSLNTTGQPLTALETFKPRLLNEFASHIEYSESGLGRAFTAVEERVNRNPDRKQRVTREVVKTFALAETGTKLPLNLSDQRQYLRTTFDGHSSDEKLWFTRQMAATSSAMLDIWESPSSEFELFSVASQLTDEAAVSVMFMRDSNHTIPQALVSRYLAAVAESSPTEKSQAVEQLAQALKASAAFWALWRAASASTENIDAAHRSLMHSGNEEVELPPIARAQGDERALDAVPPTLALRAALRDALKEHKGISSQDDWISLARDRNLYEGAHQVLRFLFFTAHHQRESDPAQPGMLRRTRAGPAFDMLLPSRWEHPSLATVEHVAPQNPPSGHDWDEDIYRVEGGRLHAVGNLTLLPSDANRAVSNRSWDQKRELFKALASTTEDDARRVLVDSSHEFSSDEVELIVSGVGHLPAVESLAVVDTWDNDFIAERTDHLLGAAWATLAPWLGYSPEPMEIGGDSAE